MSNYLYIGKLAWLKGIVAIAIALAFSLNAHSSGRPPSRIGPEQDLVLLSDIARQYDMKVRSLNPDVLAIEGKNVSLSILPGQRKTIFHGTEVWLNGDLSKLRGDWYLSEVDQRDIVDPLLNPMAHLYGYECETIVLDPGHGGKDPGAVSPGGLLEKHLALDIARRVAVILRSKNLKVHLTRDTDKYLQLGFRPRIAKHKNADIFVSIHFNSARSNRARGIETYRLTAPGFPSVQAANETQFDPSEYKGNGYNGANTLLGFNIQKSLQSAVGTPDRGLRHARYAVLKTAPCPAVLVECGFICNPAEERLLRTDARLNRIANGLANGIIQYRAAIGRARLLKNPIKTSSQ